MRTTIESTQYTGNTELCVKEAASPLLHREVICLFGLPIDVIHLDGAVQRVIHSIRQRERCIVSTPNVNFVVAAQRSVEFRRSIQVSQLVLADGSPLVWISRLMGAPLPERASGADLFEALRQRQPDTARGAMKVFFFGGQPGAAKAASESLGQSGDASAGVGFDEAGFGDVSAMSSPERLEKINASGADFLVVSLGAVKGQSWILRNQAKLHPPVISHLGAVVNFVSGRVARAPLWMQRMHLEWLYRILQEPRLWRRYGKDGLRILRLMVTQVLPYAIFSRGLEILRSLRSTRPRTAAYWEVGSGHHRLVLQGEHLRDNLAPLRLALEKLPVKGKIEVQCSSFRGLDLYALGLLVLKFGIDETQEFQFSGLNWALRMQMRFAGADYLLNANLGHR